MHNGPEEDPQEHQILNQAIPQFEQSENKIYRDDYERVGQSVTTAKSDFPFHDLNHHDDLGVQQFQTVHPTLSPDDFGNMGQGRDGIAPNRMEPFGGNIQGFQRDQYLQGNDDKLDFENENVKQNPVQHQGFRRLLADGKWTGRKLLLEKALAGDTCKPMRCSFLLRILLKF